MAGNSGPASWPLRLPYAVLIEPTHRSPLPPAVRERWSQSRKENSAEASPKARRESLISEPTGSERQVLLPSTDNTNTSRMSADEDSEAKAQHRRLQERLDLADAKRRSQLDERRTKAAAFLAKTQEAAARLQTRTAAVAERSRAALADAQARREAAAEQQRARLAGEADKKELARCRAAAAAEAQVHALEERVDARLGQAHATRDAAAAAAAASAAARAERAAALRAAAAADGDAAARGAALDARLERAAGARREGRAAVLGSLPQREQFLARRAGEVACLRRRHSARRLQHAWRAFAGQRRTTAALAAGFAASGVPALAGVALPQVASLPTPPIAVMGLRLGSCGNSAPPALAVHDAFERFAAALQAPRTLRAAQALLRRLQLQALARGRGDALPAPRPAAGTRDPEGGIASGGAPDVGPGSDVAGLLARLFPRAPAAATERYPPRVFLSAYMLLAHPKVVFSRRGEREAALAAAAADMLTAFHTLLAVAGWAGERLGGDRRGALCEWDRAWVAFLEHFVAWKCADAASLEAELVRAATEMESSMLAKLGPSLSPRPRSPADLQAVVEQLPAGEAEALWADAAGDTDVMAESAEIPEGTPPAAAAALLDGVVPRGVPPGGPAAQLHEALDEGRLREALLSAEDGGCAHLLATLETAGRLLRELGAPAREAAAAAAAGALRQRVGGALAAGDAVGAAAGAARALQMLAAQLRLLRVDTANWQLRQLAAGLAGGAGLQHARASFLTEYALVEGAAPEAAVAALPHARAWLAAASGRLPALALALAPAAQRAAAGQGPHAASGAPTVLRAGRGLSAAAASTAAAAAAAAAAPQPAATLTAPVSPGSWRGVVRLGLVELVASEAPVDAGVAGSGEGLRGRAGSLSETLRRDARRLAAAQHDFQRLLVTAACLLVVRQARTGAAQPQPALAVDEVRRRLAAVLGDPAMRLPDVAAELARQAHSDAGAAEEAAMQDMLQRVLARSSEAFAALSGGITTALRLALLAGPDSMTLTQDPAAAGADDVTAALRAALARCGAGELGSEVMELARGLAAVAAVGEAVHGDIYRALLADLL
ncbi:hypothetical protein WJX81_002286 [Elliptochloris bilobata]|uniref:Uncharacterized protein n=1 Tax=Elliptochloris bilobata TaxID=381761 RepID=A0AAW1S8V2_9CHLO